MRNRNLTGGANPSMEIEGITEKSFITRAMTNIFQ